MFARVGDSSRARDKDGLGTVVAAQATQTAQYVSDMRAENAAVYVCFIDDDVFQVAEKTGPAMLVGHDD